MRMRERRGSRVDQDVVAGRCHAAPCYPYPRDMMHTIAAEQIRSASARLLVVAVPDEPTPEAVPPAAGEGEAA